MRIFKQINMIDPKILKRFENIVPESLRSYYIMQWAKENNIDVDYAMELAGYRKSDYIGAGAYVWEYIGNK